MSPRLAEALDLSRVDSGIRKRYGLDRSYPSEREGKTLLDAMRDGDTEGMQHFDGEIERFIRGGLIDFETGLAYSTNPGNLRLELADFLENGNSGATSGEDHSSAVEVER